MTLESMLKELGERSGSDLHLLQGLPPKMRIHGRLVPVEMDLPDVAALVEAVLDPVHRTRFEERGEVDLAYEAEGAGRFRVNVFRHHRGVGAVFRLIPARIPPLAQLHIPAQVERFTRFRSGLVLVTGPTGSGKSSTLAALLDVINRSEALHIITIEDPIEFVHDDALSTFTQREAGSDTESFATALRSAARQNPDLVLVGEMRDRETIQLALTLAEMGMLVFSTLHTNGAGRSVDRIVEVFSEERQVQIRSMLGGSLRGVLSQILCRRADGEGRIPATELLFTSTAVRSVIREGASHKITSILQANRAAGMHSMDDSLLELAKGGEIDGFEAYRKASDKSRFQGFLT